MTRLGPRKVPDEGEDTAYVLGFFNKLTDAFNGKIRKNENSEFRTVLSDRSFHIDFFKHAKAQIARMRYVNPVTKDPVSQQPSCLQSLESTIEGFLHLWEKLKNIGFKQLKTNHFNQDPLENFFSSIRDCGASNRKPTCFQFIGYFKTWEINNMSQVHLAGANYVDGEGNFILGWEAYFTQDGTEKRSNQDFYFQPLCRKIPFCKYPIPEKGSTSTSIDIAVRSLRNKLPSLISCPSCSALLDTTASASKPGLRANVITDLHQINNDARSMFRRITDCLYTSIGIRQSAVAFILKEISAEIINCPIHRIELITAFLHHCARLYITSTVAFLNALLKGKMFVDYEKDKENTNQVVARAIVKRSTSIQSKHTYSILSKK